MPKMKARKKLYLSLDTFSLFNGDTNMHTQIHKHLVTIHIHISTHNYNEEPLTNRKLNLQKPPEVK